MERDAPGEGAATRPVHSAALMLDLTAQRTLAARASNRADLGASTAMNVLLIVYHKMTGVTRQKALADAEAARSEVEVRMQAA
jgi:hypothetical protein